VCARAGWVLRVLLLFYVTAARLIISIPPWCRSMASRSMTSQAEKPLDPWNFALLDPSAQLRKTIFWVRHGQSTWNEAKANNDISVIMSCFSVCGGVVFK
jgi:hypothetical protein